MDMTFTRRRMTLPAREGYSPFETEMVIAEGTGLGYNPLVIAHSDGGAPTVWEQDYVLTHLGSGRAIIPKKPGCFPWRTRCDYYRARSEVEAQAWLAAVARLRNWHVSYQAIEQGNWEHLRDEIEQVFHEVTEWRYYGTDD